MTPEDHDYGRVRPRHGRHVVPIPNRDEHPWRYRWAVVRWRLAVVAVTRPVTLAMLVALLVAAVPFYLVLVQGRHTNALTQALSDQRVSGTRLFCAHMNANSYAVNHQNDYIQHLILAGAQGTRAFDKQLRALGFPPYKERLKKAEQQATGLAKLKVARLDCGELVGEAQRAARSR